MLLGPLDDLSRAESIERSCERISFKSHAQVRCERIRHVVPAASVMSIYWRVSRKCVTNTYGHATYM
jgi:hypothetical protein